MPTQSASSLAYSATSGSSYCLLWFIDDSADKSLPCCLGTSQMPPGRGDLSEADKAQEQRVAPGRPGRTKVGAFAMEDCST